MEQQEYTQEEVRELELNYKSQEKDIKTLQDAIELKTWEVENLTKELTEVKDNPIKFIVKRLILDDFDIKDALESEIDSQLYSVKNELFDELDDKLDNVFESRAFKVAVDDYMRSKF